MASLFEWNDSYDMNETMSNRSAAQGGGSSGNQKVALTPVRAARREKILVAAEALFVSQGFRGTTIEAIAEAASMSKVTVYGYFRDKDAVFVAFAHRLAARLEAAVRAELAKDEECSTRIAAALSAKQVRVFELVRRSPFSRELFQAKDDHVSRLFETLDEDIIDLLTKALMEAGANAEDARQTAQLLFASADGIATHAKDAGQLVDQINMIVQLVTCHQS
jgi:AcrR family transcriptional regulator